MRPFIIISFLLALPINAASLDVRVADRKGAAVKDAVVYAMPSKQMALAQRVAVMDQINRTFVPHVLPVQAGTWVEFPNSDKILHQVFSVSPARKFTTPLYVGKPARPIQFPTPGIVAIGCSVHEQMSAYIVVVDTPYFARADAGRASLQEMVEGEYTLRVWYPQMRNEPKPQTVTLGAADQKTIAFVAE